MQEKEKIRELISQLTLEEKIGMIHGAGLFRTEGVERLGIPPLYMSDGPMGVRAEFADKEWINIGNTDDYVTYLPCNSAVASTWNSKLAYLSGQVLGEETRGRGKDMILAPGINIKRSPLCGRNFEYMSEDPRLIEEMAVPMVKGIQESDVSACVKHFAANFQETERLWVDAVVDERTLQEIYLPGFRAAVERGGSLAVMGAYNQINGEHCCTGKRLINEELRGKWRYQGIVVSDWGGVHDTYLAAESGLDIEMDVDNHFEQYHMAEALLQKVRSGEIDEELLDKKLEHILHVMFSLRMIGEERAQRKSGAYNTQEHQRAALEIARESLILLKNEESLLPLTEKKENGTKRVAVIGQNAVTTHSNGGGSAEIKALYEITPLMGIKKLLGGNARVYYAPGYELPRKRENSDINWQADSTKSGDAEKEDRARQTEKSSAEEHPGEAREHSRRYLQEALELAQSCDEVIFVGGLNHDYDMEGADRENMELPYGQNEVIERLLEIRPDTVIVLYAGSPVTMPWLPRAKAVLWSYYAGMEGGTAIAETLYGRNNPSGKLAETFIAGVEQCPAHSIGTFGGKEKAECREGVMVGYRYYDTENVEVLFPFGHGLSYTEFAYSDLAAEVLGGQKKVRCRVSLKVKNTGKRDGKTAVQLYVAPGTRSVERPVHELKAFEKISLKSGEEKEVIFHLTEADFGYYDVKSREFAVDRGICEIGVGASSRDIRLKCRVQI